jgi:hypothetical protein
MTFYDSVYLLYYLYKIQILTTEELRAGLGLTEFPKGVLIMTQITGAPFTGFTLLVQKHKY